MEIRSKSSRQTKELGKNTAKKLHPGDVIAFYGDLGSGKTTFIQGLIEGFSITQRVTSPTFVLLKMYISPKKVSIFHVDLYRLESNQDISSVGVTDLLTDKSAIVLIEWAEKMEALLPKDTKKITFTHVGEEERQINADWL